MIGLLAGLPWRLIGIGAAVVAIAGFGWMANGWRNDSHELARIRPIYDSMIDGRNKANHRVKELAPVDAQARRDLAAARAELLNQRAETSRAWGRVAALEETTNAETGCPVVRLSDGFGVCLAAAAGGDGTDFAACQAAGGNGTVAAGGGPGSL